MKQLLLRLEEEKDQWIYDAIDLYNEGFLRFDGRNFNREEVLIGVYGPTQVGKTTLILSMLGIGDNKLGLLSKVLRGKREKGNSATITSFIYKRSVDNNFHLTFPDRKRLSFEGPDDLENYLYNLRQQIEDETVVYDKPIILEISGSFYTDVELASKSKHVSIVELPGDDTKEKREQKYVEGVINDYLKRCNVILIMEISSNLVNLFQIDRPAIKEWMHYPHQFRIVLTRSVESTSTRALIEKGDFSCLSEFRYHFKRELERNVDDIPNKIYPLEFGDTWIELKNNRDPLYYRTKVWMEQLFLELLDDLSETKTAENQIMQIKNMEYSINKQRLDELKRKEQDISSLEKNIQNSKQKLDLIDSNLCIIYKNKELLEDSVHATKQDNFVKFKYNVSELFSYKNGRIVKKEWRKDRLESVYFNIEFEMRKYYEKMNLDLLQRVRSIMAGIDLPAYLEIKQPPKASTIFIDKTLNGYLSWERFRKHLNEIEEHLSEIGDSMFSFYQEEGKNLIEKNINRILQQLKIIDFRYKKKLQERKELAKKLSENETLLLRLKEKLEDVKLEWAEDLNRPNLLNDILKESFLNRACLLEEKVLDSGTSVTTRWIYHQYWMLIKSQAERIIDHDNYFK